MINECLEVFLEIYNQEGNGDSLILNQYTLAEGNYYFVDIKSGEILDNLLVTKKNKEEVNTKIARQFIIRDYLSSLIDMNKPMDSSKQIHSNNYRTFYLKKDKLASEEIVKIKNKSIKDYYDVFRDYSKKYDKDKMKIFDTLKYEDSDERENEINLINEWVEKNIDNFIKFDNFKNDKNYIKIFFVNGKESLVENSTPNKHDIKVFKAENEKYILPNIYNSNKYNKSINDTIYGASNNNYGLNNKKPFLLNNTRKSKVGYLVSNNDIKNHKVFFDYLSVVVNSGKSVLYIGQSIKNSEYTNVIKVFNDKDFSSDKLYSNDSNFKGYYLRLKKEKNEAEIVDYDFIDAGSKEYEFFEIGDVLLVNDQIINDEYKLSRTSIKKDIFNVVDKALFSNALRNSLYLDAKDVSKNDSLLKEKILSCRDQFISWIYKDKDFEVLDGFYESSLDLLLRHIKLNQYPSLVNAYIVRKAIFGRLNKNSILEDEEIEMWEELKEKIKSEALEKLGNEKEFSFAVGQLWYYLIQQSEASNKNYSLILPILQTDRIDRIKNLTVNLIEKYSHALNVNSKNVNKLISLVTNYEADKKVKANKEFIIAGFASKNLMFEKNENKDGGDSNGK